MGVISRRVPKTICKTPLSPIYGPSKTKWIWQTTTPSHWFYYDRWFDICFFSTPISFHDLHVHQWKIVWMSLQSNWRGSTSSHAGWALDPRTELCVTKHDEPLWTMTKMSNMVQDAYSNILKIMKDTETTKGSAERGNSWPTPTLSKDDSSWKRSCWSLT